jgi:anti-sigma-K factor RskA
MSDHELIEELISVRALGGLDADDEAELRRAMAAHGAACAECRRLEREYGEIAGRLAFALDPVPIRTGLEDQVVAATTGERALPPSPGGPERSGAPRWWARPLVAVAAAVVLFAAGIGVGALVNGGAEVPQGARVVAFEGEGGGRLAVAYRPGGEGVYLLGSGLEALPEGSVYAVWMLEDGTPVPATCFSPSADGSVFTFVDASLGTSEAMAVTVEPSSCPSAPTTAPILTAQIV